MSTPPARYTETADIVFALNKCIEICTDGEKGYGGAAADVRDPDLKALFLRKAQERGEPIVALQTAIEAMGAFSENQGTAKGAAHRGWVGVRLALEGHKDRVVIEEWLRGEEAALEGFNKAFHRAPLDTLPTEVRGIVLQLYGAIQASIDEARRHLAAAR